MHGLAVYVKEGLPFALNVSVENSADSYLCFRLTLLHSISYFLFLYQSPSLSLCMGFDSRQMRFCRSTYLLMCLSLETLISIRRTRQPILVELIDLVNSFIIFPSQTTLFHEWVQVVIDLYIPHCKYQIKAHSCHGFQLLVLLP